MSKVYSFRLSVDNPREAQARRVIESWVDEGYTLRSMIVAVILADQDKRLRSQDFDRLLKQLQHVIEGTPTLNEDTDSPTSLSTEFTSGLIGSMKKGLKI